MMDGWTPQQIRDADVAMFSLASYDDFRAWNGQFELKLRLTYRLRFIRDAVLRSLARAYGHIP